MERPVRAARDDVSIITFQEQTFLDVFPQSAGSTHCSQPFPSIKNVAAMVNALTTSASSSQNARDSEEHVPKVKAADDLIAALTHLAIAHDRQLQTLEGRHTIIIPICGQEEKSKVKNIRDEWQKQKPEKGSAHPSGASQRSVVWAQLMIIWQSQYRELIKGKHQ